MLTRRLAMLFSAATLFGAAPALAQPRKGPMHGAAALAKQKAAQAALPPATPANTPLGPVDTTARWAIVEDYNTNATLLDKSADERMPPSSMTKLMTLYIVLSRLKAGRLKLTDQLPVSEKAWKMGGSKMFVQIGTTVPVEDLLRGLVVDSGNDACIVLAEAISGSEEQFADLMNTTGKKLGLINSHFMNATGWPDDNHYMCVRDIATIARALIADFPEYYHYDSEKTFTYDNIKQYNRNPMVQHGTADGLKTGHTEAGGYGLVASTQHGDRRIVLVLNGMATERERSEEGDRLMDWAFANFEDVRLFAANDVVQEVPVWLGTSPTAPLVPGKDLTATMPRNWRQKAKIDVTYATPIRAPVAKGTTLGHLTISGDGLPSIDAPLLAGADVPRLGLPGRAMAVLAHYITGG
ncbi:MAG TPA: D-alanyl-D-alanine carboxypeptidase family protein [Acetobacteraceae bacterium]|jgi:D-alanyl-D-alanine carboxypeptidase (penicillin-binding protein 5/6)